MTGGVGVSPSPSWPLTSAWSGQRQMQMWVFCCFVSWSEATLETVGGFKEMTQTMVLLDSLRLSGALTWTPHIIVVFSEVKDLTFIVWVKQVFVRLLSFGLTVDVIPSASEYFIDPRGNYGVFQLLHWSKMKRSRIINTIEKEKNIYLHLESLKHK